MKDTTPLEPKSKFWTIVITAYTPTHWSVVKTTIMLPRSKGTRLGTKSNDYYKSTIHIYIRIIVIIIIIIIIITYSSYYQIYGLMEGNFYSFPMFE